MPTASAASVSKVAFMAWLSLLCSYCVSGAAFIRRRSTVCSAVSSRKVVGGLSVGRGSEHVLMVKFLLLVGHFLIQFMRPFPPRPPRPDRRPPNAAPKPIVHDKKPDWDSGLTPFDRPGEPDPCPLRGRSSARPLKTNCRGCTRPGDAVD